MPGADSAQVIAAKKPAATRKRKAATGPDAAATNVPAIAKLAMGDMIATAAYFIAERRSFSPGHELDDWLAAEREVQYSFSK